MDLHLALPSAGIATLARSNPTSNQSIRNGCSAANPSPDPWGSRSVIQEYGQVPGGHPNLGGSSTSGAYSSASKNQIIFADTEIESLDASVPEASIHEDRNESVLGFRGSLGSSPDGHEAILPSRFLNRARPSAKISHVVSAATQSLKSLSSGTTSSLHAHPALLSGDFTSSQTSPVSLKSYGHGISHQCSSVSSGPPERNIESYDVVERSSRSVPLLASATLKSLKKWKKLATKGHGHKRSRSTLENTAPAAHFDDPATAKPGSDKLRAREAGTINRRTEAVKSARSEQSELIEPQRPTRSSTDNSSNCSSAKPNDVILNGSISFSKNMLGDRRNAASNPSPTPQRLSTDLGQDSSAEEMEPIIAGLRRIGLPGKALAAPRFQKDSSGVFDPNPAIPSSHQSCIPTLSSLNRSTSKHAYCPKPFETSLAKQVSSSSLQCGSVRGSTPAQSISDQDEYDSEEEMESAIANLRRIALPTNRFDAPEPTKDPSNRLILSPSKLEVLSSAEENVHAAQIENLEEQAQETECLAEEVIDRRSSCGSLIGSSEDAEMDFPLPIWPVMTSTTKSPFDQTSLTSELYRRDECPISTRVLFQQDKVVLPQFSKQLRVV